MDDDDSYQPLMSRADGYGTSIQVRYCACAHLRMIYHKSIQERSFFQWKRIVPAQTCLICISQGGEVGEVERPCDARIHMYSTFMKALLADEVLSFQEVLR